MQILTYLLTSFLILASQRAQQDPPFLLPDNVLEQRDIVYGTGGGRDLHLILYRPKSMGTKRPGIVFVHGGGWRSGDPNHFRRQAAYFAGKGYVCACIEYRLSGEAQFPAAIEDVKCAVRWMRANAGKYHIDTSRIAASGGSAGGHLAALLGTSDTPRFEGTGGHDDFSSRVQAVVSFNGVADMRRMPPPQQSATGLVGIFLGGTPAEIPDVYATASPIVHVSADDPPFLFLHGSADTTVPYQQSVDMMQALREVGVRAEIYTADGATHGFFNRPPWYQPTLERMERFLTDVFETQYP